jgi:hypothetical protein
MFASQSRSQTHQLGDLGKVGVDSQLARLEELEQRALREDDLVTAELAPLLGVLRASETRYALHTTPERALTCPS